LRVLHLEGDRLHAEITRALLAEDGIDYDLARVATEVDFVATLAARHFDLILADFTLPGFDGMKALSLARARFPDLPFIFVTGTMGEEIAIDALKRGATDYILKGRLSRLAPAIRRALSETEERAERRRAEEALRHSEEELRHSNEMFRALIHASPLAIFQLKVDGTVMSWNAAAERIFGWNEEEVSGEQLPTVPQEKRKEFALTCGQIFQGQTVFRKELQRQRKDGVLIDISLNAAPVYDAQGNPSAILAMAADITEQKNLENQLRHAQKMEALGTLSGGIAHDFNNILTAIIGYGSLLEMRIDKNDSLRPFVDHILAAADRAATLTQSLLTFGRKKNIEPRVVDLNSVVLDVEKLLLRLLREDIALQTTLANSPCMVMADAGQICQVLMNLATNARDAMPRGGKMAIHLAMASLDRDFVATHGYGTLGSYVLLTVTDTGAGMDAETRSRIFEPFFTTKEVGKGTGLGLSMAYGIVKQHNGYITCYSEPGAGTTFRIYLPTVDAQAEMLIESSAELPPGGTEMILLAEDDEQVRVLTSSLLEKFGYTVIPAHDGKDALVQFHAHRDAIQLVLLDVIMPGMNGREACEEMRARAPRLKALFTSGYSADIFKLGEFDEPGFAFISKPALPVELLKKIRQLLDE
jgi:two-component system, cell cycle sensor histidine kinase and response regulator CckA